MSTWFEILPRMRNKTKTQMFKVEFENTKVLV